MNWNESSQRRFPIALVMAVLLGLFLSLWGR
jgi:hypothetical protein